MIGNEASVRIQGTVESILFALAISIAAALKGLGKKWLSCGWAGEPGCSVVGEVELTLPVGRSAGVMMGEEKQRR